MYTRLIDVGTGRSDVFVFFNFTGDPVLVKQAPKKPFECSQLLELPDSYTVYDRYIQEFCSNLSTVIELG